MSLNGHSRRKSGDTVCSEDIEGYSSQKVFIGRKRNVIGVKTGVDDLGQRFGARRRRRDGDNEGKREGKSDAADVEPRANVCRGTRNVDLVLAGCHAEYMVEKKECLPANIQRRRNRPARLLVQSSKSQYPKVEVELSDHVT